jgi:hypothetical protein
MEKKAALPKTIASLVEREGLQGKVKCINKSPAHDIQFNSNL